jgi:hypothetical protein
MISKNLPILRQAFVLLITSLLPSPYNLFAEKIEYLTSLPTTIWHFLTYDPALTIFCISPFFIAAFIFADGFGIVKRTLDYLHDTKVFANKYIFASACAASGAYGFFVASVIDPIMFVFPTLAISAFSYLAARKTATDSLNQGVLKEPTFWLAAIFTAFGLGAGIPVKFLLTATVVPYFFGYRSGKADPITIAANSQQAIEQELMSPLQLQLPPQAVVATIPQPQLPPQQVVVAPPPQQPQGAGLGPAP